MSKIKAKKSERRRTRRLAFSLQVKIWKVDSKSHRLLKAYLLETKDINQKGLFLSMAKPLPIGTKLKLEMKLKKKRAPLVIEGEVAWIAKPSQVGYYPGIGIRITKIKRGGSKELKDFLREKFRNYRHAVELKKMYAQLKEMAARLYDMEQAHPQAEHFRRVVDRSIKEIDNIAHVLDREVWEVKSL